MCALAEHSYEELEILVEVMLVRSLGHREDGSKGVDDKAEDIVEVFSDFQPTPGNALVFTNLGTSHTCTYINGGKERLMKRGG